MKSFRFAAVALFLLAPATYAATITYVASLSGPNEFPPNLSLGTGFANVLYNNVANTLEVQVTFAGLGSGSTASHIHCCTTTPFAGTAGVATQTPTFTGFPLGVTSGSYDHTFNLGDPTTYNQTPGAFLDANGGVAGAEAALLAGLANGTSYLNIHTTNFPAGEIRGFLVPAPEPVLWPASAVMLLGLAVKRRLLSRGA